RQRLPAAPDAAALAHLGPPRDRRRIGRALQRLSGRNPGRFPPRAPLRQGPPMATIDIKVPNIGDIAEVSIIEVMVQPGDTIKAEQSLITVESDKASMEIPSSHAGVVKELKVKLGDKVQEGSVVLTLETQAAGAASAPVAAPAPAQNSEQKQAPAQAPKAQAATNPVASSFSGTADL